MKSIAAPSPAIPIPFNVPASNACGSTSGCVFENDKIPVPPVFNGRISTSFLIQIPPIPCGPIKPLCPVKHNISILSSFMEIGITPALWAVSTTNKIPFSLQSFPTLWISNISPVTLDACVIAIILVSFVIACLISSTSGEVIVKQTPCRSISYNGRRTLLCSINVVITWSPWFKLPLITVFKLSVIPLVNTTCSAP